MDTAKAGPSPTSGSDDGRHTGWEEASLSEALAAFSSLDHQNAQVLDLIGQRFHAGRSDQRALLFISKNEEVTPKRVAEYLLLSTGATTALLDRLAAADFIRRVPHPRDRRSVVLELGPIGHDVVDRVVDFYRRAFRDAIEPQHVGQVAEFLRLIGDSLTRTAAKEVAAAKEKLIVDARDAELRPVPLPDVSAPDADLDRSESLEVPEERAS